VRHSSRAPRSFHATMAVRLAVAQQLLRRFVLGGGLCGDWRSSWRARPRGSDKAQLSRFRQRRVDGADERQVELQRGSPPRAPRSWPDRRWPSGSKAYSAAVLRSDAPSRHMSERRFPSPASALVQKKEDVVRRRLAPCGDAAVLCAVEVVRESRSRTCCRCGRGGGDESLRLSRPPTAPALHYTGTPALPRAASSFLRSRQ